MPSHDYRTTLKGVADDRYNGKITHYRGIKYATVSERFAKPVFNIDWPGDETDCTKFGPRCPQRKNDIRDLMRIPKELPQFPADKEDELKCTNLNVTIPTNSDKENLPVLLWIYGGAQTHTHGSASQRLGDPAPLVAQSVEQGKPIILVSIHYRLHILGFGPSDGEINLDLQDQRVAIKWVKKYIAGFGGDPNNITVSGESAGGIYSHALLASGSNADIVRAILCSGNLFTTPPQSEKSCQGLVGLFEGNLALMELEKGNMNPSEAVAASLLGAPIDRIVQSVQDLDITSKWMWQEKALQGWEDIEKTFGKMKGIMIGDCEFEAAIYQRYGQVSAKDIARCFQTTPPAAGQKLAETYGIDPTNEESSRQGVLDYFTDARFSWSSQDIAQRVNAAGGTAYQYHFDQVNPFNAKARAHHAVDIFAMFGAYDDEFPDDEMRKVGNVYRDKWIAFINGEEPWSKDKVFGFGPKGKTGELTDDDRAIRRRQDHFAVLKEVGHEKVTEVWQRLRAIAGERDIST